MKVFSSDKGFTLIETMVAIGILAVGTLGVGTMLMLSFISGRQATEMRRAESMGMQRIEELKAQNTRTNPLANGTFEDPNQTYVYKWNVSNYTWAGVAGANSGLSQLDVTVGWPSGGACTGANPENCKYRCAVTTFFKPQKF